MKFSWRGASKGYLASGLARWQYSRVSTPTVQENCLSSRAFFWQTFFFFFKLLPSAMFSYDKYLCAHLCPAVPLWVFLYMSTSFLHHNCPLHDLLAKQQLGLVGYTSGVCAARVTFTLARTGSGSCNAWPPTPLLPRPQPTMT